MGGRRTFGSSGKATVRACERSGLDEVGKRDVSVWRRENAQRCDLTDFDPVHAFCVVGT